MRRRRSREEAGDQGGELDVVRVTSHHVDEWVLWTGDDARPGFEGN